MAGRIGVDIGGTFTDFIYQHDEDGVTIANKVLTTPQDPGVGCLQAITESLSPEQIRTADVFLHGTTVGLNALLQRKGAVLGMLATHGLRDVLHIRRGDRFEPYDLFWKPPEPLVPRRLRRPVRERILADGSILTPLVRKDVEEAVAIFRDAGVTSIAVTFFNSYANARHELEAERILREAGFAGEISLSHRVSGEYREYERASTTVVDAFVRGFMTRYLRKLEQSLREAGFGGEMLITRSGGGALTFREAEERSFETIMSGPVAGAEGTGEIARALGVQEMITADVGGTSFDTCLVLNGRPQLCYEGNIIGMPIQNAWVDVRSIGSGGGSIAWIDAGGLLRVGPESAGSCPGPACYGKGGTRPTLTDAALALGMLGEGRLAAGLELDRTLAERALRTVADPLGYTTEKAAQGIVAIANASMVGALREISIGQGIDPRHLALVAFGGAGPLMCTLLARELGIRRIVVPPHAGNFSAWGLLGSEVVRTRSKTLIATLDEESLNRCGALADALFAELTQAAQSGRMALHRETFLDLRFKGQEHRLTIPVDLGAGPVNGRLHAAREEFRQAYRRKYGSLMDAALEIVSVRATARSPLPRRALSAEPGGSPRDAPERKMPAYSFAERRRLSFAVVNRESLRPGRQFAGPALVHEPTSTLYLDAGFVARVHETGCLILEQA